MNESHFQLIKVSQRGISSFQVNSTLIIPGAESGKVRIQTHLTANSGEEESTIMTISYIRLKEFRRITIHQIEEFR